jgi:hypothetical protein
VVSSAFDSEVYAERNRLPGVSVNLARLMQHLMWLCEPHKATLEVEYRPDVETSQWWTLRWGDQFAAAQTLELCLFRAAVIARRSDERAQKYAKDRYPDANPEVKETDHGR